VSLILYLPFSIEKGKPACGSFGEGRGAVNSGGILKENIMKLDIL